MSTKFDKIKGDLKMKRDDCIFCKLANGEIPTNAIYEDEDFKVILDASPATRGHALILPKEHAANICEMDSELLGKAAKLAQRVIAHETKVLGCEGYNLVQNNGEVAGQTVFHFHMHLIPRYEADNNSGVLQWRHREFSDEEFAEICSQMKF
jgi:histidine triad (HIT) family protein